MATIAQLNVRLGLLSKDFDRDIKNLERSLQSTAQRLSSFGSNLTTAISLPLIGIGAAAIKSAGDLEALKLALTSTMQDGGRSVAEATAELEALRKASLAPGLDLEQAIKGSIRLQSVGFAAERARGIIVQLANAIALTGGTAENLDEVVNQFTQMIGKGKIYQEDLRIILGQMPKLATIMKEAFGATTAEGLNALGITAEQFIDTVTAKMQELPRVSGGIKNAIVNLFTGVKLAADRLGDEINRAFNIESASDSIVKALNSIVDAFAALPAPIKQGIVLFAGFAAAAGPVIFVTGKIIAVYATLRTAVLSVAAAYKLFFERAAALKVAQAGLQTFTSGLTVATATATTAQQGLSLAFASTANAARNSTKAVAAVNAGVAGLSGASAVAASGYNSLTGVIQKATAAFAALNTVQKALVVGGIIAAVAGLVYVIAGLNRELSATEKAQRAVNDVNVQAKKDIAGQKAEVERLTGVIQNENATLGLKERALKQLQAISPQYYGSLVLAKGRVEGLTEATDAYVSSLYRAARAQAAQDKIAELARKNIDLEEEMTRTSSMYDRLIAGPFVRGEKAIQAARNARLQKEIAANDETIKSLSGLILKVEEAAAVSDKINNTPPPKPPDPAAIEAAARKADLYKKALASIAAVAQKGDVLGAEFFTEQAREIESQIERLLENGFKPFSKEILHLRDMMKQLRADVGVGFETPNLTQQTLGFSLDIPKIEIPEIPQQVFSIDITPAKQAIEEITALQSAATQFIENQRIRAAEDEAQRQEDWRDGLKKVIAASFEAAQSIANSLLSIQQARAKQEISDLEEEYNAKIAAAQGNADKVAALQKELAARREQIELESAKKAKRIALINAAINIAEGITKALGAAIPPFNFILAGITAAAGAVQIAAISAQPLAKGGVIDEPTLALVGEYPGAKSNPEIVTPENKMREVFQGVLANFANLKPQPVTFNTPQMDGQVVNPAYKAPNQMFDAELTVGLAGQFLMKGEDMLLVVDKAAARRGRIR